MFLISALVMLIFIKYGNSQITTNNGEVGIIGGHNVNIEKVPYIASLRINGTTHYCGSTIIHERFILTAAHCIVANRSYKVLVGTAKVDGEGNLYDVDKIILHPKYNNKTFDYDISIVKLNETLTFGTKVNKIELSDKSIKLKRGIKLNASGWGYTKFNGTVSKNLQQVEVPMVSRLSCQISYGISYLITSRMICAGGHGKDACSGDSGGPLTYKNTQVGITSFGAGCGTLPGVYTKVAALLPWIKETINQNL